MTNARVSLIGVPYDAASSYLRGAAEAPGRIREALASTGGNMWSEDLQDLGAQGAMSDAGDVDFIALSALEVRSAIRDAIGTVLKDGATPLALGGDHSVSYPVLRAIAAAHGPVTILHIDAHPDLYEDFEGDRYSHACPFARVMEDGLASRLVQVGIRAMSRHQRDQADRYAVDVIDMRAWEAGTRPSIDGGLVYLSIDLDGIDPAYTPGVSHQEPGGLTTRDVITLVQNVGGTVVGADIVELNPSCDLNGQTARVAAKLVKEVAARMLRRGVLLD